MNSQKSNLFFIVFHRPTFKILFTLTFLLALFVGIRPTIATVQDPAQVAPTLSSNVDFPEQLLAQVREEYLVFDTPSYSVRVFDEGNGIRMNVIDLVNDVTRLSNAPTAFTVEGGNGVYISLDDFSGQTATYKAIIDFPDRIQFVIEIGDSRNPQQIIREDAIETTRIALAPQHQLTSGQATRLAFDTSTYSIRVFQRDGQTFMNAYNRFSGESELNGEAANVAESLSSSECSINYTASGERNNIPVRYYAQINEAGGTRLEIYNINRQRLFQEVGAGPVTIDIPEEDLPSCLTSIDTAVESAFVVAVFGDQETLADVQQLYPDARMERVRREFINVGAFPNRDLAFARALELRGRGFNSRVLFRDVDYR